MRFADFLRPSEGVAAVRTQPGVWGPPPNAPLFLAPAPPVDPGGGNSMATGFLQRAGAGRRSATARVQSVLGAEFWEQTQPKALSAWQW